MTNQDSILAEIARRYLGIQVLATRNLDSLDFHDVAVWRVADALKAAFDAGAANGDATSSTLLEALRLAQRALNTAPRFRVGDTDSYAIAAQVDRAISATVTRRQP